MRADGMVPTRQTLYRAIDEDEIPDECKKRGHRKKYFTPARTKKLLNYLDKLEKKSDLGIEVTAKMIKSKCKFDCADQTLRDELHRHDYYWLSPRRVADLTDDDKKFRMDFCKKYMDKTPAQLKKVFGMMLDEKTWNAHTTHQGRMYNARKRVRKTYRQVGKGTIQTRPGTKHAPKRAQGKKVNVCGGIRGEKIALWHYFPGAMSATKFCTNAFTKAMKTARTRKLVMDNAGAHKAKKTQNFLKQKKIVAVPFPPRSPDLMPMDFTVWEKIQQKMMVGDLKMRKNYVEPIEDYKKRLRRAAMTLTPKFCNDVWRGLKGRLRRCYEAKGGAFKEHRLVTRR